MRMTQLIRGQLFCTWESQRQALTTEGRVLAVFQHAFNIQSYAFQLSGAVDPFHLGNGPPGLDLANSLGPFLPALPYAALSASVTMVGPAHGMRRAFCL